MTAPNSKSSISGAGEFDILGTELNVDHFSTPNRWVMAPMTRRRSPGGTPTSQVGDYYARRAAGGVGLVITEGIYLDLPSAGDDEDVPRFDGDAARANWRAIVARVHAEGSRIFAQLWHLGPQWGEHRSNPSITSTPVSPSGIGLDGSRHGAPMSHRQIDDVIASYVRAASTAQAIGFDGVEIHGAHGYLLDSFLWTRTNERTDDYGGSAAARAKLAAEVVAAIRAQCPRLPVSFRFSQWKVGHYEGSIADTPGDLEALLVPIREAGATLFHASTRRFWEPAFEGSDLSLAGWAKKLTARPAIAVGSIGLDSALRVGHNQADASTTRFRDLSARLLAGEFDLAAVGRALLANPDWVPALRSGSLQSYTPQMRANLV